MCQESNMSSCRGAAVSRHLATRLSEHVRVLERGHNTRKRWNQNILFGTFSTWVCLIVGTPSTNTSGGGAVLSNDMIKVNLRETHTEEALSGHQRYITHWACLKASPLCLLVYWVFNYSSLAVVLCLMLWLAKPFLGCHWPTFYNHWQCTVHTLMIPFVRVIPTQCCAGHTNSMRTSGLPPWGDWGPCVCFLCKAVYKFRRYIFKEEIFPSSKHSCRK